MFLASALVLVAYLLTLGRVFTWDAIAYAGRLDENTWLAETWSSTRFFNPQHLLYFVVGYPFKVALKGLGIAGDSVRVLQVFSAILGAGSALLIGWILTRATGSLRRGVVCALGFGLSQAAWRFSTSVEVVVPAAFFFLLGLFLLGGGGGWRRFAGAGVSVGVAILIHQLTALLALVLSLSCLVIRRKGTGLAPQITRGGCLVFAATWVLVSLAAYVLIGFAFVGVESPGEFLEWASGGEVRFFEQSVVASLINARRPLANSFVSFNFPTEMENLFQGSATLAFGIVVVLLITLLLALTLGSILILRTLRECSPIFPGILLGILLIVVFNVASNPWNEDSWFYLVPLGWLVIGFRSPRDIPPPPMGMKAFILIWLVLMGGTSLFGSIFPLRDSSRAHYASLLRSAEDRFEAGDLLVNGPMGPVVLREFVYLAYFGNVGAIRIPPEDVENREEELRRRLLETLKRSPKESPVIYVSDEALPMLGDLGVKTDGAKQVAMLRGSRIYRLPPSAMSAIVAGQGG